MEILHLKDLGGGGYKSINNECSLGVNLVRLLFLCSFRYFTSVYNLKAIGPLLMEILHFEDLGDTVCHLAANAVVLVLRKYQISIATYPHIKF